MVPASKDERQVSTVSHLFWKEPVMRTSLLLALALSSSLAMAQSANRPWQFGIYQTSPTLEGHFLGKMDNETINFDIKNDLGLDKDTSQLGLCLEYQGPRFGLELSTSGQDYKGSKVITRTVSVGGTNYQSGTVVDSSIKLPSHTLNWTIRIVRFSPVWIGIDLGARIWALDIAASGTETATGYQKSDGKKKNLSIPQLGASAGFNALGGKVMGRAYYHFLSRSGASYKHTGADLRFFPLNWLGVRAFMDNETFDIPAGSIEDDLELKLDHNGVGFGVVVRF
jgi:hypothetical protein